MDNPKPYKSHIRISYFQRGTEILDLAIGS